MKTGTYIDVDLGSAADIVVTLPGRTSGGRLTNARLLIKDGENRLQINLDEGQVAALVWHAQQAHAEYQKQYETEEVSA